MPAASETRQYLGEALSRCSSCCQYLGQRGQNDCGIISVNTAPQDCSSREVGLSGGRGRHGIVEVLRLHKMNQPRLAPTVASSFSPGRKSPIREPHSALNPFFKPYDLQDLCQARNDKPRPSYALNPQPQNPKTLASNLESARTEIQLIQERRSYYFEASIVASRRIEASNAEPSRPQP